MKNFTYVIAPDGCESYLTPGKKYAIKDLEFNKFLERFSFSITTDKQGEIFCLSVGCLHLNGKNWIIPEIGQWPEGWTKKQKKECLVKACVIENELTLKTE